MGERRTIYGKRLLMLVFFLMFSLTVGAQEKSPDINVITYPDTPVVGQPWTFTLFVDYPEGDDVTVIAPQFDESLSLDRILKMPRVMGNNVQTVFEYRFIPTRSGRFLLKEFTVVCPVGSAQTDAFVLDIRAKTEEQETLSFQLDWEIESPRSIRPGERVILALRGWDSQLPTAEFFLPQAPPGLILALSPPLSEERKNGVAARLIAIPLEVGNIRFDARFLQYENINFNISALQINVIPQNTPILNSRGLNDTGVQINDSAKNISFIEIVDSFTDFSDDSINKRILQRRFLFGFSILIIILVIITPLVCLFLFVRKK
jgi:hypothetical protein